MGHKTFINAHMELHKLTDKNILDDKADAVKVSILGDNGNASFWLFVVLVNHQGVNVSCFKNHCHLMLFLTIE